MDMGLQQHKNDGIRYDFSTIVEDQWAKGLSDKVCKNGICNIRHQLSAKFFDERNPSNLDISGMAICAFGPLSDFTRRINRQFFTANNELQGQEPSVETCRTTCLGSSGCQAFSARFLETDLYECVYFTVFPRDEDLVEDTNTVVYTRNDVIAPL